VKIQELLAYCIQADPDWSQPVLALGELHEKAGREAQAEQTYRRFADARAGCPGHAIVAGRLLSLLERQDRFGEAAELLRRFPESADLPNRRRTAAAEHDRLTREALPLFQQAVAMNPESVEVHWGLATAAHWVGDLQTAEREYRRVIELSPNHGMALNNLAWILCQDRREPQQALPLAETGVRQDPGNARLQHTLGIIREQLGSLADADKAFERCVELADDLPELQARALVCLARVRTGMGKMSSARSAAQRALHLDALLKVLTDQERNEAERVLRAAPSAPAHTSSP
jgi:Tfp pilus assembly protein PilF